MKPRSTFTKRKKIIVISLCIGLVYFGIHALTLSLFWKFLIGSLITYFLTCWALDFDLKGFEYIILPIIPILFYLSMLLAFPILELLRVEIVSYPFLVAGIYILLLTFNILNIATVKPIPLNRAAWISLTLWRFIIAFLVYTFLFWFHFNWMLIALCIFIFTVFLTYPGFYLLIHQLGRGERSFYYIITVTVLITEVGFLLSFWNIPFYGSGLILAAILYISTGVIENHLKAQLTSSFFWEYGIVGLFAILLLFIL